MDLSNLENSALLMLYGEIIEELKRRNVIRSKNVVGDIGEYLAVDYYTKTSGLPKLQFAPPITENIDAISVKGERYSIKCTTNNRTGVFYGLNAPDSTEPQKQLFVYVIIVVLNDSYQLKKIIELDWNTFLKHKKWQSRVRAWYLTVSNKLLADAKIIFDKQDDGRKMAVCH